MTDLLCMRLCPELSQAESNPREMQSRGRSFHMVYWALLGDQDCLAHGVDLHVDDLHSAVDLGQRLDAMERLAVRSGEPRQGLQLH